MKKVWATRNTKGFTIVELLIVVVVIAILAAITIVAYNGIQQRAKNATIVATVDGWEKALRMAATNGFTLPPSGTCLGKAGDYPASDGFGVNECAQINGSDSGTVYSESVFSTWTPSVQQRPSGKMPIVSYNASGTVLRARGLWVFNNDSISKTISIYWVAQVDGSCARGTPAIAPVNGSFSGGYCGLTFNYS